LCDPQRWSVECPHGDVPKRAAAASSLCMIDNEESFHSTCGVQHLYLGIDSASSRVPKSSSLVSRTKSHSITDTAVLDGRFNFSEFTPRKKPVYPCLSLKWIIVSPIDQVRRSVSGGSDSPSTSTVQRSPLSVGCPAVSVPELTISPALKGWFGNRRTMAALSSDKHKAGLLKQFLPDPSSTNSPFFDMRTLNRGSSSTSAAMPSGRTCTRSPIASAA